MVLVAVMLVSCGRRDDNALCPSWWRDGEWRMKVNVEIDCTPEEARRAMGLPDLTPIHERYVQMMLDTMQSGVKPEMIEAMMRNWAPMGEASMSMWRRMFEGQKG
jgi:hypothetical protein